MSGALQKECPSCGYPWATEYNKCPSCGHTPINSVFTPVGATPFLGFLISYLGYTALFILFLIGLPLYLYWLLFKKGYKSADYKGYGLALIPFTLWIVYHLNGFALIFLSSLKVTFWGGPQLLSEEFAGNLIVGTITEIPNVLLVCIITSILGNKLKSF